MEVIKTELDGVLIIEPKVFSDARGFFYENFQAERYEQHGMPRHFVQDNVSYSTKSVVRGLHYQLEKPQGKLVHVLSGNVLDVIVDIRRGSKTFGKSICIELSDTNHRQVYIPPGFAHGYGVLSESAVFMYKCTDYYHPASERGILWNDPDLNISWRITDAILSPKDLVYPQLKELPKEQLPE
jgi:dTDP-4-dehydrorhamnose 3,5-epimerase